MNCEPISSGMMIAQTVGFVVSLSIVALYSFLETSVTAMRLFKLKEISRTTSKFQKLFMTLETSPHEVLLSILIANCVANVSAAALLTTITDQVLAQLEF